jgi:hypothetical protein
MRALLTRVVGFFSLKNVSWQVLVEKRPIFDAQLFPTAIRVCT